MSWLNFKLHFNLFKGFNLLFKLLFLSLYKSSVFCYNHLRIKTPLQVLKLSMFSGLFLKTNSRSIFIKPFLSYQLNDFLSHFYDWISTAHEVYKIINYMKKILSSNLWAPLVTYKNDQEFCLQKSLYSDHYLK